MQLKESNKQLSLLEINTCALSEGLDLLMLLTNEQYSQGFKPAFQATIGAHFRHVLEHYLCFLGQMKEGVFCYDKRQRDQKLEQDRLYAIDTIKSLIESLNKVSSHFFAKSYLIDDQQIEVQVKTSLDRELLFLQSHSVHHYAIIAAMTRLIGEHPAANFGIAFATLTYLEEQSSAGSGEANKTKNTAKQSSEDVICAP